MFCTIRPMEHWPRNLTTTCLVSIALGGCFSDPPRVSNVRCTPQMLSVAGPGPYTVQCEADCSGNINETNWKAVDTTGTWQTTSDSTFFGDCTRLSGQLSKAEAPAIGPMTITVDVYECDDCSPGNMVSTKIEVVP
jgi:hypothetical protein